MTIRRQWLRGLLITAVLAVCINSVILSSLINRYFLSFTTENYNNHVGQIEELAKNTLMEAGPSYQQLSVQLESHLDDPIVSIKLYNAAGRQLAGADSDSRSIQGMMGKMMRKNAEEVDSFNIVNGGNVIGVLHITRYSSLSDSSVSSKFRAALVRNSALSFAIVLIVLVAIGRYTSGKLSRDLTSTAAQALSIDLGDHTDYKPSKVKEIRIIQSSLDTLNSRLKIKQIGRKRLVDELVHQTRTPLTILKAHLEGFEDGIITMTPEEIRICEGQIESLTAMISNMSMLLDADRPSESITSEDVEIYSLLNQIAVGMKVQFEKKNIALQLLNRERITVMTDKYKLSQCIYNLLTNAYKFTEPGGKVEISYDVKQSKLTIGVKDTGRGIDSDDMAHLFDAYYRGSNSGNIAGEGLGLFIVKENLDKMKGTIAVESARGHGSSFIITLPLGRSDE